MQVIRRSKHSTNKEKITEQKYVVSSYQQAPEHAKLVIWEIQILTH